MLLKAILYRIRRASFDHEEFQEAVGLEDLALLTLFRTSIVANMRHLPSTCERVVTEGKKSKNPESEEDDGDG